MINSDRPRSDLGILFKKSDFKIGAEIGVEQGKFAETILRQNPELTFYLVDPWKSFEGQYIKHNDAVIPCSQEIMDIFYENTLDLVSKYPNVQIIRKFSMDAVKDFKDNNLDFVYIDGSHQFDYVMTDIIIWGWKVKKGGIISGHDYYNFIFGDVVRAVDNYARTRGVRKINLTDENTPSWWFKREW